MARDYARKLEAVRAYAKTPAGKASRARSEEKRIYKQSERKEIIFEVNTVPLLGAINNWR